MKSSVSLPSPRRKHSFLLLILLAIVICVAIPRALVSASDSCPSCTPQSNSENPFASSRRWYAPATFGLPMGQAAPAIDRVEFSGHRTMVVVLNGRVSPEAAVLSELSTTGVQIAVVLHGFDEQTAENIAGSFGNGIITITDPTAYIVCAEYRVGPSPVVNPIVFFVNETGTIIYRRIGTLGWLGYDDNRAVKYFAAHGKLPPDIYPQYVLWYGDEVPTPPFPLRDLDGHDRQLDLTRLTLFYFGGPPPSSERGQLLFPKLDQLRKEFPQVRFVWVLNYRTDDELAELYRLYNRLGLANIAPQWFAIPFDVYMARATAGRDEDFQTEIQDIRTNVNGWSVFYELDNQLSHFWGISGKPSIMVVDAHVKVVLPFTLIPYQRVNGEYQAPPNLVEPLRSVLKAALEGE